MCTGVTAATALDIWRSQDLGSAECASLTTRMLRNSPLQSVTGVWTWVKNKKKNSKVYSFVFLPITKLRGVKTVYITPMHSPMSSPPIIGSAEALPILCVRYFRWEREREREREIQTDRERERRKWRRRHHRRAKIGDEFTLSLAKNLHNWRWAYTFPCQKFALFVSPFTFPVSPFAERSPWWRWNAQWVHTFHCQKFFRPQALFSLFQMARAAQRVIENPRQMIKSCPVLFFFPSKKWIKLIPKTIGNRKRDCAWGGSGW